MADPVVSRTSAVETWVVDGVLHRGDGPALVRVNGDKEWYHHGKLHRLDGPASIRDHGRTQEYYRDGLLHREDGPASITPTTKAWYKHGQICEKEGEGFHQWYQNGVLSREDGPAVIYSDGEKREWYLNGLLHRAGDKPAIESETRKEWLQNGEHHRDGDQPAIINEDGSFWFVRGERHREDGEPAAVYCNGKKEWYVHNLLHRGDDLPAVINPSGTCEWWSHGIMYRRKTIGESMENEDVHSIWCTVDGGASSMTVDTYFPGKIYPGQNKEPWLDQKELVKRVVVAVPDTTPIPDQWVEGWKDEMDQWHRGGGRPAIFNREYMEAVALQDLHSDLPTSNGVDPSPVPKSFAAWYHHGDLHRDNDHPALITDGMMIWARDGSLHRDGDKPAVVRFHLVKKERPSHSSTSSMHSPEYKMVVEREEWWVNGWLNRGDDKPAISSHVDGVKEWWLDGRRSRGGDQPAVTYPSGHSEWWVDGERHRDGNKPAIITREFTMGKSPLKVVPQEVGVRTQSKTEIEPRAQPEVPLEMYYVKGKLHREEDRPAVSGNWILEWRTRGLLHRLVGPARALYVPHSLTSTPCEKGNQTTFTERWENGVQLPFAGEDCPVHYHGPELTATLGFGTSQSSDELPYSISEWGMCMKWAHRSLKRGQILPWRENGLPSLVDLSSDELEWRVDGVLSRSGGGPQLIKEGVSMWFDAEGRNHREHGLPAVISPHRELKWYFKGKLHREGDSPAEYTSSKDSSDTPLLEMCWLKHGVLTRVGEAPAVIKEYGTGRGVREWYDRGALHSTGDCPARLDGTTKEWYYSGSLHREDDEPARITDHSKEWWDNGNLHRDGDKPAVELNDGTKEWWRHGKRHRDGGKPAVEKANGDKLWYYNGVLHRLHGPASVTSTHAEWYSNGKLHRDGLPAAVGTGVSLWYRYGEKVGPE